MSLPREITLEKTIEDILIQDGYRQGYNENYDKGFAIDKKYLFEFLEVTQPEILDRYKKAKGKNWEFDLMNRLHSELERKGIIEILRHGFEDVMLGKFQMLYGKPNSNLNPKAWEMYEKNIFSITRQLKYSEKNENSLDIVLFLNGLPIVTLELKNEYTGQNVYNAIKQYREDRDPKEQLFKSRERVLVHFAVDTSEVFMATELKGKATFFLPFNKGNNGGKGNQPVIDNFKTHYLWDDILTRSSLTDIIKRFYYIQNKDGREIAIFPRYHQLDVVRKVEKDILMNGTKNNYLIQHSAGSGKTNSIAWLSHRLANLHSMDNNHIFDSVLVITDRKVLDKQLQDAVYQLEHKNGVVEKIDDSKTSSHLAKAIDSGTKIIITTIQKFPYALEKLEALGKEKKFAVIIDEAHSSTSGKNMNALKDSLTGKSLEEENRTSEDDIVDLLKGRTEKGRVVFFAFTATPKHKTLEIFGTKDENNYPHAFHLYTMKQAIEEGFILDILKNYTTYEIYYKVAKKITENREFDSSKATREIKRYVSLHEYNIRHKVEMIVDDFVGHRMEWLGRKSKGMVVTSSRLHALRFKQEIDKYVAEKGYGIKSLVAFSGTVIHDEIEYTEEKVNKLKEKELPKRFGDDDSTKLLIVAEKYQTGFDEPKLCAMYVDKVLSGVAAVQTLSRLNRTKAGKDATFILDFTNSTEDIQNSFAPYFETTIIDHPTDPNILLDMYNKLHKSGVFLDYEIEEF
ncbi:MAG: type I restriction endonuclease subunit R, partial [Fusobacteriaceae bacterium]